MIGAVVLVSCHTIAGPIHKIFAFYIQFPNAVDDDMTVNIPSTVIAVAVSADDHLMTGKSLPGKLHAELLRMLRSQPVFIAVVRIKTDDIVMSFDLAVRWGCGRFSGLPDQQRRPALLVFPLYAGRK